LPFDATAACRAPHLDALLSFCRNEVIEDIPQPQDAVGAYDAADPCESPCLPEVRQAMEGEAGIHEVRRVAAVLIGEEPRLHHLNIREFGLAELGLQSLQ
jgi:hypothetical protein